MLSILLITDATNFIDAIIIITRGLDTGNGIVATTNLATGFGTFDTSIARVDNSITPMKFTGSGFRVWKSRRVN